MKILLLEDEVMLRDSIKEYLQTLGHIVEEFADGKVVLEAISKEDFDLLILDVNVPNVDGFEILEELRSRNIYTPTIYVTAMSDIEDIEKGFTLGCSDYLKKPFHLKELALRIEKLEKESILKKKNHILLSKNYSYDKNKKVLFFNGIPQKLTKKQLQIINLLATNIELIVDFDKFRDSVWNSEYIDNPTIRAEVHRLKSALKEDFIVNIRGLGYKIERFKDN